MKRLVKNLSSRSKKTAKSAAKKILGAIPPPKSRLTGTLAINGGTPVRQTKFRPWPVFPNAAFPAWVGSVGPAFRKVFLSGTEGLPQPRAKQFADEWARYCDVKHALLVPHGTDALRIGIAAALDHDGLEFGGEVIVPNLSFVASATAALDRRFGVALVDVDPRTLNIDPARVEWAIRPGVTKAIMAVHLFGQPADMASLRALATKYSLALIEDAAQAHGAIHEMGRAGSLGDVAAFSFQAFKNLPSGEGGALTTNDDAIFERAYGLHNVGRKLVGGLRWGHETLGWNLRPSEYIGALLLERLKKLETQQQLRWERFQLLRELLAGSGCVEPLAISPGVLRHGVHMFVMRYRKQNCGGLDITDFIKAIRAEGIPLARAYEKTLSQQPVFTKIANQRPDYVRIEETPISDEAVKNLVYLPHPVFLSAPEEIEEVAAAFRKVEAHYSGRSNVAFTGLNGASSDAADIAATAPGRISVESVTQTWRIGLIGAGVMGMKHVGSFSKTRSFRLAAVYDLQLDLAQKAADEHGCVAYASAEELLSNGEFNVAVIATPHWQHAELAAFALRRGLHVVCEKPLTVTVGQADELLAVAAAGHKLLVAVHQTRLEPSFLFLKQMLDRNELGSITRCSMTETLWRSDAYYRSSPWRGTWKGEGGGVLLNQAPHVLDRYAWLCGMPSSVFARCDSNLHAIETEDTVSAIFRHSNGMHGSLHINTCESPSISETVICCDRGRVVLNSGRLQITKLRQSIRDATRTDERFWGEIPSETRELEFAYGNVIDVLLVEFYKNLADALAGKLPPVCSGIEARNAVELANAIVLSSFERREVSLPLNRLAYDKFINDMLNAGIDGAPSSNSIASASLTSRV